MTGKGRGEGQGDGKKVGTRTGRAQARSGRRERVKGFSGTKEGYGAIYGCPPATRGEGGEGEGDDLVRVGRP